MRWSSAPRRTLARVGGEGRIIEAEEERVEDGQTAREREEERVVRRARGRADRQVYTPWLVPVLVLSWLSRDVLATQFSSAAPARLLATDVCEFRTVNYITHTLPQQCLRTSWSVPVPPASSDLTDPLATTATASLQESVTPHATAERQPLQPGDGREHVAGSTPGPAEVNSTAASSVAESSPSKPGTEHENTREEESRQDLPMPGLDDAADLASGTFMSFEEWREMMVRKAGQDLADGKSRKPKPTEQPRADRDRGDAAVANSSGGPDGALGAQDGDAAIDYDAMSNQTAHMTGSAAPSSPSPGDDGDQGGHVPAGDPSPERNQVPHEDGHAPYPRSKDAGKTCKERFSYASFDGGATIIKASPGAKNAKAVLVENKDSYMLLECQAANKFVIVELSDDILVDTVVLANFEFFSSMVRGFRVGASDRWPPRKPDQWVDLGTFEARNSRDIQPFLIQHPQIYSKYLRIEFLTHYGNEFYCPVSLLRVHGTRMLDSWKDHEHEHEPEGGQDDEGSQDDEPEQPEVHHSAEVAADRDAKVDAEHDGTPEPNQPSEPTREGHLGSDIGEAPAKVQNPPAQPSVHIEDWTPWRPSLMVDHLFSLQTCVVPASTPNQPDAMLLQTESSSQCCPTTQPEESTEGYHAATAILEAEGLDPQTTPSSEDTPVRPPSPNESQSFSSPPIPTEQLASSAGGESGSRNDTPSTSSSPKQASASTDSTKIPASSSPLSSSSSSKPPPKPPTSSTAKPPLQPAPNATAGTLQNNSPKTPPSSTSSTTAGPAQPTVQESFFKAMSKRLQQLEANTSLSVQYLEEQSRVLREAFRSMERRHAGHINTLFLEGLNHTGMPQELRALRTQYDELWQSTVLALEAQHDQQARETLALGTRLELLADEVIFQRRMAILQSVLLLACLLLIIFSNRTAVGGLAARYVIPTPGAPPPPTPSGGVYTATDGPSGRPYAHFGPALAPSTSSFPDPTLSEGAQGGERGANPGGSWEESYLASPILSPIGGFFSRQFHHHYYQQQQRAGAGHAGEIPRSLEGSESCIKQDGYDTATSNNKKYLYNKSLPLTPTSGCSRAGTPTIQIDSPVDDYGDVEKDPSRVSFAAAAQRPASSSSAEEECHEGDHALADQNTTKPSFPSLVSSVSAPDLSIETERTPEGQTEEEADARGMELREGDPCQAQDGAEATKSPTTAMSTSDDDPPPAPEMRGLLRRVEVDPASAAATDGADRTAVGPASIINGARDMTINVNVATSTAATATPSAADDEFRDPESEVGEEAAGRVSGRRPARPLSAKSLPPLPEDPT